MNRFIPYCLTFLFLTLTMSLRAQCYQRISLVGGCSVQIIPKTVVCKPKNKDQYKQPFQGIQFQRKGNLISIQAIEISKNKYLNGLESNNYAMSLIDYTRNHYAPIDSTCIVFDTLQTGQIHQQYLFVDLFQTNEFYSTYSNCTESLLNYSSIKKRLLVVDNYLYIFSVQAVQNCQSSNNGAIITKKAVQPDFRRLIGSIKIHKPK